MICLVSLLLCLSAASSASALDLTAMTLCASNSEIGLWTYEDAGAGFRCTIENFRIFTPGEAGNVDLVGPSD